MPTQSYETELHNLGKLTKELRELFKLSQTGKYQKTKLNVLFCTKQCVLPWTKLLLKKQLVN